MKRTGFYAMVIAIGYFLMWDMPRTGETLVVLPKPVLTGTASWYSESDNGVNVLTSNGELFDDRQNTCASWSFDFDTFLRVTDLENGKSVVCRVNDRGPAQRLNRVIDLSQSAFREIADPKVGLIRVMIVPLN